MSVSGKSGVVYILTNESMPGLIKIGKTGNLKERLGTLNNTSVPFNFQVYFAAEVEDMDEIERSFHDGFVDARVNPRREFFRLDPARAYAFLKLFGKDVTPREQEETDGIVEASVEINQRQVGKGRTDFNAIGIPIGSRLHFVRDRSETCVVLENGMVEFEGEATSLSKSAMKIMKGIGYNWTSIQGTKFWLYGEKTGEKSIAQIISEHNESLD